jgi:hypothetical protein
MKIISMLKTRNTIIKISIGIALWCLVETLKMGVLLQIDQAQTKCMLFKLNFI